MQRMRGKGSEGDAALFVLEGKRNLIDTMGIDGDAYRIWLLLTVDVDVVVAIAIGCCG